MAPSWGPSDLVLLVMQVVEQLSIEVQLKKNARVREDGQVQIPRPILDNTQA